MRPILRLRLLASKQTSCRSQPELRIGRHVSTTTTSSELEHPISESKEDGQHGSASARERNGAYSAPSSASTEAGPSTWQQLKHSPPPPSPESSSPSSSVTPAQSNLRSWSQQIGAEAAPSPQLVSGEQELIFAIARRLDQLRLPTGSPQEGKRHSTAGDSDALWSLYQRLSEPVRLRGLPADFLRAVLHTIIPRRIETKREPSVGFDPRAEMVTSQTLSAEYTGRATFVLRDLGRRGQDIATDYRVMISLLSKFGATTQVESLYAEMMRRWPLVPGTYLVQGSPVPISIMDHRLEAISLCLRQAVSIKSTIPTTRIRDYFIETVRTQVKKASKVKDVVSTLPELHSPSELSTQYPRAIPEIDRLLEEMGDRILRTLLAMTKQVTTAEVPVSRITVKRLTQCVTVARELYTTGPIAKTLDTILEGLLTDVYGMAIPYIGRRQDIYASRASPHHTSEQSGPESLHYRYGISAPDTDRSQHPNYYPIGQVDFGKGKRTHRRELASMLYQTVGVNAGVDWYARRGQLWQMIAAVDVYGDSAVFNKHTDAVLARFRIDDPVPATESSTASLAPVRQLPPGLEGLATVDDLGPTLSEVLAEEKTKKESGRMFSFISNSVSEATSSDSSDSTLAETASNGVVRTPGRQKARRFKDFTTTYPTPGDIVKKTYEIDLAELKSADPYNKRPLFNPVNTATYSIMVTTATDQRDIVAVQHILRSLHDTLARQQMVWVSHTFSVHRLFDSLASTYAEEAPQKLTIGFDRHLVERTVKITVRILAFILRCTQTLRKWKYADQGTGTALIELNAICADLVNRMTEEHVLLSRRPPTLKKLDLKQYIKAMRQWDVTDAEPAEIPAPFESHLFATEEQLAQWAGRDPYDHALARFDPLDHLWRLDQGIYQLRGFLAESLYMRRKTVDENMRLRKAEVVRARRQARKAFFREQGLALKEARREARRAFLERRLARRARKAREGRECPEGRKLRSSISDRLRTARKARIGRIARGDRQLRKARKARKAEERKSWRSWRDRQGDFDV